MTYRPFKEILKIIRYILLENREIKMLSYGIEGIPKVNKRLNEVAVADVAKSLKNIEGNADVNNSFRIMEE